jgi:hypothetical protein
MSKARELSKLPNYVLSTVAELKLAVGKEQGDKAFIGGYYADADGGGGDFYWDAVSVEADNGGTIFQVTGTATGRWKRIYSGSVSVKWFGTSNLLSKSENKAIIENIINIAHTLHSNTIEIDYESDYGFINNDISTYLNLQGCQKDIVITDYSEADSDGSSNKAGAQERTFYHTVQTTPFGMHDGNGMNKLGNWHPYVVITNTANHASAGAPSRLATDNRRASLFISNDGVVTWRVGQGNVSGSTYSDEQMSNFVIESFTTAGDTLGNFAPLVINKKTGNWSVGAGETNPIDASYKFKSVSLGYYAMMVESLYTKSEIVLRNVTGITNDLAVQNNAGSFEVNIIGVGVALTITRNRDSTFQGYVKTKSYLVANLPSASTSGVGARLFITDGLTPVFGSVVVGGGAIPVPVYSDGSSWRVG